MQKITRANHRPPLARTTLLVWAILFVWPLAAGAQLANNPNSQGPIAAGADTKGGDNPFASVIHVTTLADAGPGSLRQALLETQPRIIVFDVAGYIALKSDLSINRPFVTIAGQTAPAPGITIRGGTLRIRTHNVVIQHIAVRPGPGATPKINQIRDAINIARCPKCQLDPYNIRIENVSASWATDEVIGMWGPLLREVTVRNSIIAEGLRRAGHPKGSHSAGMLVHNDIRGVEITGNLFANNVFRSPAINPGVSAFVANNHIYNSYDLAIHINSGRKKTFTTRATIIANVLDKGPNSTKRSKLLNIAKNMASKMPDGIIYADSNDGPRDPVSGRSIANRSNFGLTTKQPTVARSWKMLPVKSVRNWVATYAGMRPGQRNAIDTRLLKDIANNRGRIIDLPKEAGGYLPEKSTTRTADVPRNPFSPSTIEGMSRIGAWLCLRHQQVGGPPTPECRYHRSALQAALDNS